VETLVEVLKTTRPYWENENQLSLRSDKDMAKWPTDDMFATWGDNVRHTLEAYCGAHLSGSQGSPAPVLDKPLRVKGPMAGDKTIEMQQEDGKTEREVRLWEDFLGEGSPVEDKHRRDRVLGDESVGLDIPSDADIPVCGLLDSLLARVYFS
jgi:hypothetical protein